MVFVCCCTGVLLVVLVLEDCVEGLYAAGPGLAGADDDLTFYMCEDNTFIMLAS